MRTQCTYTPPLGLDLDKIRKWLAYTMSWCICKLLKSEAKHTTTGEWRVCFIAYLITLHMHQKMVHTSHFLIFVGPNSVVVYIYIYIYIYIWCPRYVGSVWQACGNLLFRVWGLGVRIFSFFQCPNPVVVHTYGVPIVHSQHMLCHRQS